MHVQQLLTVWDATKESPLGACPPPSTVPNVGNPLPHNDDEGGRGRRISRILTIMSPTSTALSHVKRYLKVLFLIL